MTHSLSASIESSSHFTLEDLGIARHLIRHGVIRLQPLVSHRLRIGDTPSVYEIIRDRPGDLRGVIFDWAGGTDFT